MKTATYQQLARGDNAAWNLHYAMEYCRKNGIEKLTIEPGTYEIDPTYCSQRSLNISNHGQNGPKRIAILIENMENFEIDCSGSTFICNGIMTPIAVINSKNICIRNLKLKNPSVPHWECRVVAHGEDYIDVETVYGFEHMQLIAGHLFGKLPDKMITPVCTNVEFDGKTGFLAAGTADHTLGHPNSELFYEPLDDTHVRIRGASRKPPVGNVLLFCVTRRLGCSVFSQDAQDLTIENVDLCSGYGMGILAQASRNITLRHFNTTREDGHLCTIGADATHFVNCSGQVVVEDCEFVGQLDDALNIHGIYSRIVDKGADWITLRMMQVQALGIPVFKPGNTIQIVPPDTLLPYTKKTIKSVEVVNDSCVVLHLEESADDIHVGDDIENVTLNADLIFRNNIVRDNRARGMLVGTAGKVLIENCDFHTSGTAIKFESSGSFWYESGATTDVTIRGNRFTACKYCGWGTGVIECAPRERTEKDRYFHGIIRVCDNTFDAGVPALALMDNIREFEFTGNRVSNNPEAYVSFKHVQEHHIQDDVAIQ